MSPILTSKELGLIRDILLAKSCRWALPSLCGSQSGTSLWELLREMVTIKTARISSD
jgi:hypothetical protein